MSRRLHQRTEANGARSQLSTVYRGFDIDWHPDSWEFSFVAPSGERLFARAQFSARREIDRLLDGSGVEERRRGINRT